MFTILQRSKNKIILLALMMGSHQLERRHAILKLNTKEGDDLSTGRKRLTALSSRILFFHGAIHRDYIQFL